MRFFKFILGVTLFHCGVLVNPAKAAEGFRAIDLELPPILKQPFSEFPSKNDCGAVRIHEKKPYFLSALHCIRKGIESSSVKQIGPPMNYELLVRFSNLKNREIHVGHFQIRILDHGNCYTGFALDAIALAPPLDAREAMTCLKGDWVIYERLDQNEVPTGCLKPSSGTIESGGFIFALGGSRVQVQRKTGLTQLNGRIFSRGQTFLLKDLLTQPNFPPSIVPLWKKISEAGDLSESLMITSADVINGMSGGPVVYENSLVGISTVALLPNFIYDYPGLSAPSEGYNFGIHGAVRIQAILNKSNLHLFACGKR